MKQIKKSVIKLSELPIKLQKNEIFKSHKLHTYAEFHIDDFEKDELSLWLIENYPTILMKISFLIHIDSDEEIDYSENEIKQTVEEYEQKGLEKYSYELESKQETLEEAAEIITTTKFSWEQERSYSEEDMKDYALKCISNYLFGEDFISYNLRIPIVENNNKQFEKFKNK
jgi:hypothetical protein